MAFDAARFGRQDRMMSVLAMTLAAFSLPNGALATGVAGVDVSSEQIVVRFDGDVEKASLVHLDAPRRIAVDVAGADKGSGSGASGFVAAVRQGQFSSGTARIVFHLANPAVVTDGQFSADGRSLILSVSPVAPDGFSDAAKQARKLYLPPVAHRAAPPRSRYTLTVPLDPPSNGLPKPRILGTAGRPLVVIDAGHGGHDPGAINPQTGQREKDVTLGIARRIRDELVASGRVRVALTREDDHFLILRERSAIARNIGADLFISVHADSAAGSDATGATIYTLSEVASDREAQLLAARENRADVINGVNLGSENADVASILVDLAQRETMNNSAGFASLLKREGSSLIPFRSDYHRMAGFAVLKAPDTPSILLEVGYISSPTDVVRIVSSEGQRNIATGVRRAVEIHFAKRVAAR
jgi:N-acetylmuramoyl-L-alanine amidase